MSLTKNEEVILLPKRFRHLEELNGRNMPSNVYWLKKIVNMQAKTFLGRTASSWLKIIIFYIVFYLCLACLWGISFDVFFKNLNFEIPRVLQAQPGFSFQPCGASSAGCRIDYVEGILTNIQPYVAQIYKFLHKFGPIDIDQIDFGPCTWRNQYGYSENKPCIFLKMNRIIGFKVDPIYDIEELPQEAAETLKQYMVDLHADEANKSRVWISCTSNIFASKVKIAFFPHPYVSAELLDVPQMPKPRHEYDVNGVLKNSDAVFYSAADYQRIVAIQVSNLPLDERVHIQCFMWAKNIKRVYGTPTGKGMLHFDIYIRSNPAMNPNG